MAIRGAQATIGKSNTKDTKMQKKSTRYHICLFYPFGRFLESRGMGGGLPQLTLQKVVSCELKSHEAPWC